MVDKFDRDAYNGVFGHSNPTVIIESLVGEINRLRFENAGLRRKIHGIRIFDKKCWNCGRHGHLARACCNPARTQGNWRGVEPTARDPIVHDMNASLSPDTHTENWNIGTFAEKGLVANFSPVIETSIISVCYSAQTETSSSSSSVIFV